jgi:stage III sporulation protein AB
MRTLLGKTLILLGCTLLGVHRGLELRRRRRTLEDLSRRLAGLAREMAFSLRPLEELMAEEAAHTGGAGEFFAACCQVFRETGGESWGESWTVALAQTALPLHREDKTLLHQAGQVLGRYDSASQTAALEDLSARLDQNARQAREEENRLFRVYVALGVSAGVFVWILL